MGHVTDVRAGGGAVMTRGNMLSMCGEAGG